jgi:hypothetical protein
VYFKNKVVCDINYMAMTQIRCHFLPHRLPHNNQPIQIGGAVIWKAPLT